MITNKGPAIATGSVKRAGIIDDNPTEERRFVRPNFSLRQLAKFLAGLLVIKVTASIVLGYGDYFPPDFRSDFLFERKSHFHGLYSAAFYVHLIVGPLTLLLGLLLLSARFRQLAPSWHRRIGRVQLAAILMLLAPSGLVLAPYAFTGAVAAAGLGTLAVATAACAMSGWRAVIRRRFAEHRRWMTRTFLLLCSAVVIRLMGGAATVTGIDDPQWYTVATWTSWSVPLLAFELVTRTLAAPRRRLPHQSR